MLAMKAKLHPIPNTQVKPQPWEYSHRVGCAYVRSGTNRSMVKGVGVCTVYGIWVECGVYGVYVVYIVYDMCMYMCVI